MPFHIALVEYGTFTKTCLRVIPNLLVGIQFWRISRKEYQHDAAVLLNDESLGRFAMVILCVIGDDQDRLARVFSELLQEADEARGVHAALEHRETHIAAWGYGADDVQAKATAAVVDHRSLADLAPGCSAMGIAASRRLVKKVDVSSDLAGALHRFREGLRQVLFDLPRVLSIRLVDRSLRTQPQVSKQTTHRAFAQLDSKLPLDQCPQGVQCPQAKIELILLWVAQRDNIVDPSHVIRRHLSWPPRTPFFL